MAGSKAHYNAMSPLFSGFIEWLPYNGVGRALRELICPPTTHKLETKVTSLE